MVVSPAPRRLRAARRRERAWQSDRRHYISSGSGAIRRAGAPNAPGPSGRTGRGTGQAGRSARTSASYGEPLVNARDLIETAFAPPPARPGGMGRRRGRTPYEAAVAEMEARVALIAAGEAGRAASGWWSIPRSTPPAPRRAARGPGGPRPIPRATGPDAGASSPIMGQASASPMSCSTSSAGARMCAPSSRRWSPWLIFNAVARLQRARRAAGGARRRLGRGGREARRPGAEDKIAAIGIRMRKWVSFHGIALNVEPDLEHFSGIVPCRVPRPRRHQPGRPRPARDHAGCRRGAARGRSKPIFRPTVATPAR